MIFDDIYSVGGTKAGQKACISMCFQVGLGILHKGILQSKKALKSLYIKDFKAFSLARCKGFCRYFVSASACPPHAVRAVPCKPLCAENVPPAPFLAAQTLSGSNPLRKNE